MALAINENHEKVTDEQQRIRELVLAGLEQVKEGKTKDFYEVFDRLEKKYSSAI